MKAYSCEAFSNPPALAVVDVPTPQPKPGELLIRIGAVGLGYVDALICSGGYQLKSQLPFTPGSEATGEVVAVGAGVDDFKKGDRVMALVAGGALAEFAVARSDLAVKLPASVDQHEAAACGTNYCTAFYALTEIACAREGETVLVLGAGGGLGLGAIDIAKLLGLNILAACGDNAKRDAAIRQGAAHAFDYREPNWREAVEDKIGRGRVDIVFDPVGGPLAEPAFRMLAPKGRYLVLGFVSGEIARLPMNLPLLKRASLHGADWGGALRSDLGLFRPIAEKVMAALGARLIAPQTLALIDFEDAPSALANLLDRRVIGKQIVTFPRGGAL